MVGRRICALLLTTRIGKKNKVNYMKHFKIKSLYTKVSIAVFALTIFCFNLASALSLPDWKNSSIGVSAGSNFTWGPGVQYGVRYKLWFSPYQYVGLEYSSIKLLRTVYDFPSDYTMDKYHLLYGIVLRNKTFVYPFAIFSFGKSRELQEEVLDEIWPTTYSIRYGLLFNIRKIQFAFEVGNGNISTRHMEVNGVLSYNFKSMLKVDPFENVNIYAGMVNTVARSNHPRLGKNSTSDKEYFFEVRKNEKVYEGFITWNKMIVEDDYFDDISVACANVGIGRIIPIASLAKIDIYGNVGIQAKYLTFIVSPGIYGGLSMQIQVWRFLPFIKYRYMYNRQLKYDLLDLTYYTQTLSFGVGFEL